MNRIEKHHIMKNCLVVKHKDPTVPLCKKHHYDIHKFYYRELDKHKKEIYKFYDEYYSTYDKEKLQNQMYKIFLQMFRDYIKQVKKIEEI